MSGAKEKKKIGLTTQIFIALIVGAILGIVLHVAASDVEFVQNVLINGVFYVIGQGFIRLMQMLVVPLVFCSLICGATRSVTARPSARSASRSSASIS